MSLVDWLPWVRNRRTRELAEELRTHLEIATAERIARGEPPMDAAVNARREFGNVGLVQEVARDHWSGMALEQSMQDLSFALRSIGRQRGWAAVTLATLALGIGATTGVFSVVSTLLIHAMPYPNADRIVYVYEEPYQENNAGVTIVPSAADVRDWMKGSRAFEQFQPSFVNQSAALRTTGEASPVAVASVLPTFARFAGQQPIRGRMFTQDDIGRGGHVLLIGEGTWRERFGGSDSVLEKAIFLDDSSYRVVGIMPAALRLTGYQPKRIDFWIPLDLRNDQHSLTVLGLLRPGVAITDAARDLDSAYVHGFGPSRVAVRSRVTVPARQLSFYDSLMLLTAAVALVLLVAFTNAAHLLLARSAARKRELAIRIALGAGRGRLLRQLLSENILLTLAGAALGIALGWIGLRGLVALRPAMLDELGAARLDMATLTLSIGFAAVSGIVFGVLDAVQVSRWSTTDALKAGAPNASQSREERRLRAALVVSEMALSATLMVCAVMLVRSMINLQRTDLGFEPRGLYSLPLPLAANGFATPETRAEFVAQFVRRVRAVPGVTSVAVASVRPGWRSLTIGRLEVQGERTPNTPRTQLFDKNNVQTGYFGIMGIPLVEGTAFTDTTPGANQVIVNEALARAHWPGESALGHRLRVTSTDSEPWLTIVGVVGSVRISGATTDADAPGFCVPLQDVLSPNALLRTTGDATSLAPVAEIARSMGIRNPPRFESAVSKMQDTIAAPRFIMLLLTIFTIVAMTIAAIGLYGVMMHWVAQETRQIGIRVALGATAARIGRAVLARAFALTMMGAALGLVGATWATRIIESQLHGVTRLDPASFAAGALLLAAVALLACIVPVRRALAVDPMTVIRTD